jgi:hypothetical protein
MSCNDHSFWGRTETLALDGAFEMGALEPCREVHCGEIELVALGRPEQVGPEEAKQRQRQPLEIELGRALLSLRAAASGVHRTSSRRTMCHQPAAASKFSILALDILRRGADADRGAGPSHSRTKGAHLAMTGRMIDQAARDRALHRYGIPLCLHVPIAAVDASAIGAYVGQIRDNLSGRGPARAFLVEAYPPAPPEPCYPIWDEAGSSILHQPLQVWVHIGYTRYRQAYRRAFPDEGLGESVLSHAMNRKIAALKGFDFVRITPTSRSANSSSAFSEGWGKALHADPYQMAANRRLGASIAYADLTDLMLMLDMKLGGGVMDTVNEGRKLVRPRS